MSNNLEKLVKTKSSKEISGMFSEISGSYDFLNHLFSFNCDKFWRRKLISRIKGTPMRILDLCSGTGDVSISAAQTFKCSNITSVDISYSMLELGQKKIIRKGVSETIDQVNSDVMNLPLKPDYFDVITMAFGLRNLPDRQQALKSMKTLLAKDGQIVILEFVPPEKRVSQLLYRLYLNFVIPVIGKFVSRSNAYYYLASSIEDYISPAEAVDLMKQSGFHEIKTTPLFNNSVFIYEGTKH